MLPGDIISFPFEGLELCVKFPAERIAVGAALVVMPLQAAVFVREGKAYDVFETGRFTVKASNFPLLCENGAPDGEPESFDAEIWFVNLGVKFCVGWQLPELETPEGRRVEGRGHFIVQITDPGALVETLLSGAEGTDAETIEKFLCQAIQPRLGMHLQQKMVRDKLPAAQIQGWIPDATQYCRWQLDAEFRHYGIAIAELGIKLTSTAPADAPLTWFAYIDGQQVGGQTVESLAGYAARGIIGPGTLAWRPGMAQWAPMGSMPELAGLFTPPPPPSGAENQL